MTSPLERIISRLEQERKKLDHEFKIELPKAISVARAHGDLSENAEYHAAKERHAFVLSRMGQIDAQLARLKNIELSKVPRDRVGIYSKVTLFEIDTEKEVVYQLVTAEEADLDKGLISTTSPLGKGLMGHREGDEVTIRVPSGVREFEVISLATLHDQAGRQTEAD